MTEDDPRTLAYRLKSVKVSQLVITRRSESCAHFTTKTASQPSRLHGCTPSSDVAPAAIERLCSVSWIAHRQVVKPELTFAYGRKLALPQRRPLQSRTPSSSLRPGPGRSSRIPPHLPCHRRTRGRLSVLDRAARGSPFPRGPRSSFASPGSVSRARSGRSGRGAAQCTMRGLDRREVSPFSSAQAERRGLTNPADEERPEAGAQDDEPPEAWLHLVVVLLMS